MYNVRAYLCERALKIEFYFPQYDAKFALEVRARTIFKSSHDFVDGAMVYNVREIPWNTIHLMILLEI